jgi:hypothetical protein
LAKSLSQITTRQINNKRLNIGFTFKINDVDRSNFLKDASFNKDKNFGSTSAQFVLDNIGGVFGDGGGYQINVGDIIEFKLKYLGNTTEEWPAFYGKVDQRNIEKTATDRTITINCLDHISLLQLTDVDLDIEATKILVEEETLEPQYLPSPNNSLAQIYNFANNSIAQDPPPLITIRPKDTTTLVGEEPQFDGFEILYSEGQLKLGTPLNALYNYDLIATSYYIYPRGLYAEDIIEQILTSVDGYGKYMYGETSAQNVIDNHLKETFLNTEGTSTDTLLPNLVSSDITIYQEVAEEYDPDSSLTDVTVLVLDSTEGLPSSGTAKINGEIFSWTSKTLTTLEGITATLKKHPQGSYVKYEATYAIGQVWYHKFSNITSTLTSGNYQNLSGSVINYIDYRFGRIILDSAIPTNTDVTYSGDYTFKTLQASGVELNRMRFNPREVANKFEAIKNVLAYLAPNYVIRTEGTNKIWSSYLSQNVNADYDLTLVEKLSYLEDSDLFTRVKIFGRNNNPTNLVLNDGVEFVSTDQEFKAVASQSELQYEKEEGNFYVYKTTISDAGRIDMSVLKPTVYINNVPVNDKPQVISLMPVIVTGTQRIETDVQQRRSGSPTVTVRQYFYYKIRFAHTNIDPTQTIHIYNSVGQEIITVSPNDGSMDYANGIYNVPGTSQNGTVEQASTANYTVFYSTAGIDIDADTVRFKVSKQLLPGDNRDLSVVAATFQYWTALTPFDDVGSIIDGRFETQVQTEFFAEPPNGLPYAILDLGQIYNIQAIDFVAGFYRPDQVRKFDVNFRFSLQYSLDNVTYFSISPETQNVDMSGGSNKSFEEKDLGPDFEARYLRLNLEDVKRIEYGEKGVWVVAFSEVSAYDDIILNSEAKLIPTTYLSEDIIVSTLDSSGEYPITFTVEDASAFDVPESGETATAYIGDDAFTYTGIQSGDTFIGVEGLSSDHDLGDMVSQTIADDNNIYDYDGLLPKLGDRLYKEMAVREDILYDQTRLNALSRAFLAEFVKNHSKIQVEVLFSPYLKIGQTVSVTDPYQRIVSTNYFIESIRGNMPDGNFSIVLAKYPS